MKRLFLMMMMMCGVLAFSTSCETDDGAGSDDAATGNEGTQNNDDLNSSTEDSTSVEKTYLVSEWAFYRYDAGMKQVVSLEYDDEDRIVKFVVDRFYFEDGQEDTYRYGETTILDYESDTKITLEIYSDYDEVVADSSKPIKSGSYTLSADGLVTSYTETSSDNYQESVVSGVREVNYLYDGTYITSSTESYTGTSNDYSVTSEAVWTNNSCSSASSDYDNSDGDWYTTSSELEYNDVKNLANIDINVVTSYSESMSNLFEYLIPCSVGNVSMSSSYLLKSCSSTEVYGSDASTLNYAFSYEYNDNGAAVVVDIENTDSNSKFKYEISYK